MAPHPDIYDAGRRRLALAEEVRARERDQWLVVDRSAFEATLVHEVRPPWWQVTIGMLLAVAGGSGVVTAQRFLHVEAFSGGRLYRATIGDIPRGWPRKREWEVPDGWVHRDERSPG